jgi:protoheme IX farnesyltransferase
MFGEAMGRWISSARQSLISYFELFKPRQSAMLVVTGILGYLIASHGSVGAGFFLIIPSLVLAVAGATGLNMYFDRDIDSAMFRTKDRPIPSKRVSTRGALLLSSLLFLAGLILAFRVKLIAGICEISGFLIYIVLYTILLRRRTSFSVVACSPAGGMPALAGYVAFSGKLDLMGGFLLLLVSLWALAHIWIIASYYVEDYQKAGVPMIPSIYGIKIAIFSIFGILLAMNLAFLPLFFLHLTTWLPPSISLLASLPSAYILFDYLRSRRREELKKAFKFLTPYLPAVFLTLLLSP